jgi:hypothetical protein
MQTLRKWLPPAAPLAHAPALGSGPIDRSAVSGRDLAFCAEFAAHGGIAERNEGFDAEADLVRMQAAGLVLLTRNPEPPFVITRVKLTDAAREFLARGSLASIPSASPRPASTEAGSRRNGFETARAMITSTLKAELAATRNGGRLPQLDDLERRLLSRIDAIELPALRLAPVA